MWLGLFPTFFASSSFFKFFKFISFLYASASSIIFRFSLCIFSISAASKTSSFLRFFTIHSISCRPANCEARHLLSPAIISNDSSFTSLTIIGCIRPRDLIESASSLISFSLNFFLGCSLFG